MLDLIYCYHGRANTDSGYSATKIKEQLALDRARQMARQMEYMAANLTRSRNSARSGKGTGEFTTSSDLFRIRRLCQHESQYLIAVSPPDIR
ncbi:hypothetical protein N7448_007417 [Penicillium atrosanguineum]|nr:hypothetical protein N7448_007417 [Penicillium atrosanguineum]KAJ5146843.1 hypothetical protein N7526_000195 [Penicillium atrosanguineum]